VDHLPGEVRVEFADIRDAESVRGRFGGAELVFHLAANPQLWARRRSEFESVNHQGTVHVLDAAIAAGARRIVHCSTESILTRAGVTDAIDEQTEITEADVVGPYCLSKLRAEQAAIARARAGHPVLVATPTMPVGSGDRGCTPPSRLVRDFATGRIPATIEGTLNLVDVRDVAVGLLRVAEQGAPGRRYLLGGENLSISGLFEILAELTGRPAPRWRIPYPLALGYAAASEFWADWVTGRCPQATLTGVRLTRRLMHFDCHATWEELRHSPRPIREALGACLAWLNQKGAVPVSEAESRVTVKS
jgi:dihydroflavonol-4-reductase